MKTINSTPAVKTLSAFIAASHLPESLIRAVVRQMGGWEAFTSSAEDIANHGIDGGFSGFIYCSDTHAFAQRNIKAIARLAKEQADEMGIGGAISLVQSFNCLRKDDPTEEEVACALFTGHNQENGLDVLNALAWYAGEEVARSYTDLLNA